MHTHTQMRTTWTFGSFSGDCGDGSGIEGVPRWESRGCNCRSGDTARDADASAISAVVAACLEECCHWTVSTVFGGVMPMCVSRVSSSATGGAGTGGMLGLQAVDGDGDGGGGQKPEASKNNDFSG